MNAYCLPWAKIDWPTPATPQSVVHDDIYWSRDQALAEKAHVFIQGNNLTSRFARLRRGHFTIAEIGFGFGTNFLLAASEFLRHRRHGRLNYIAFERSPVAPQDLATWYAQIDSLKPLTEKLLAAYPLPSPGWHCIELTDDVSLILALGDAQQLLPDMDARIDAWFLDGFSPRTNPDAWSDDLYSTLASASRPGATCATYSVAGPVRRGLANAGFSVARTAGFGRKAEMLTSRYPGQWTPAEYNLDQVTIVGAGVAGLNCARALRRRGLEVKLYDRAGFLAGASGAPRLAVYPRLAVTPQLPALFSLNSCQHALRHYRHVRLTGRCQLANDEHDTERLQKIAVALPENVAEFVSDRALSERAGLTLKRSGLWLSQSGHIDLHDEFRELEEHVVCREFSQRDLACNERLILATGVEELPTLAPLNREPVRGQLLIGQLSTPLNCVVGGPVSLIPLADGQVLLGSTYDKKDTSTTISTMDTATLLHHHRQVTDGSFKVERAWVGVRSTTRDRQPIAGPLPDWPALLQFCNDQKQVPFTDWKAGHYVITGLGSHGASTAPLLAEHIVRQLTGEAGCLGHSAAARLNPARFALRDAGRRHHLEKLLTRQSP